MVEGVNSTQVHLVWNFTAASAKQISIDRERLDGTQDAQIASLGVGDLTFEVWSPFNSSYEANPPGTLVIKNVTRNDEYVYSFTVFNSRAQRQLFDEVTVDVLCKY